MSGATTRRAVALEERAAALARRVDALLGDAPTDDRSDASLPAGTSPSAAAAPDPSLPEAVERTTGRVVAALGDPPVAEADPGRTAALGRLAIELHELGLAVHAAEAAAARRRVAACERGLERIRTISTAAALLDAVCDEVAGSCGFERVLLSRVDDDTWSPWMVNAAVRDADWWVAWNERQIPVSEVPFEARLVAEHRPGLVTDTSTAGAHRFFQEGRSSSYVAAPIAATGAVVGFLHADHGFGGRCDTTDRDLLWMFAEGFAHRFERAALTESVRHQREEIREVLTVVDAAMAAMTETELQLSGSAAAGEDSDGASEPAPSAADRARRLAALTPREREVLEMIVAGARNADIAAALTISETTVKTHVRRVLSKLGVRNRTQAIAWAMRDPG